MALDIEFRKLLEVELEKTLNEIHNEKNSNISSIWNCKSEVDFLYGWHMAKVEDFCINQFFRLFHKNPTLEDKREIQGILFLHGKDYLEKLQT
ncbi:hypothetical protein [Nitrosopumilus sp.]|uniref:hypothetical protein n=1 Tax=Nitrosopumilus sp. TaxID=2024843 RepID=UPI003D0A9037